MRFNVRLLSKEQKRLRRKILQISYKKGLSHIGSCLSAVDGIYAIFSVKKRQEKFVLSNGHAGVALYAVLGKISPFVHPDRNKKLGIDVSTGSLGMGLGIAVGLATSDRKKNVYCMVSDGEMTEGIVWEALRVAEEQKLSNLKIIVNANGWGAYGKVELKSLLKRIRAFCSDVKIVDGHNVDELKKELRKRLLRQVLYSTWFRFARNDNRECPRIIFAKTTVEQLPFLKGQEAHYHVMTEDEFKIAIKLLA